jgi:hypothetical protein
MPALLIIGDIFAVHTLELAEDILHKTLVEIFASQVRVSIRGFHLCIQTSIKKNQHTDISNQHNIRIHIFVSTSNPKEFLSATLI